jgi:hypothetical protein
MVACSGDLDRAAGVGLAANVGQIRIDASADQGGSAIQTSEGLDPL